MSRSWPRVMSPTPGRSTLITSAPNQARSWVQVGPDCTCVKSRMRTPSSALPAWPKGLVEGRGNPFALPLALPFALLAAGFFALSFTTFLAALLDLAFVFAFLAFLVAIALLVDAVWSCPAPRSTAGHNRCDDYFLRTALFG